MADFVCGECIVDESLCKLVEKEGAADECGFCDGEDRKVLSIERVAEHVRSRLRADYSYAVEVLGWAEGGYVGVTYETYELLDNLQLGCDDTVLQAIHDEIDEGESWCDSDVNGTPGEILAAGWDEFQTIVKHETRYFLSDHTERSWNNPSAEPPSHSLELAAKLFDQHKLFTTLPMGSLVYRVRDISTDEAVPSSPHEFGPPPLEHCVQSNRMNPPGISAMYVSLDPATSVAEVPAIAGRRRFVASFEVKQDVLLLDISNIPRPPPFLYDGDPNDRHMLEFLDAFSKMCALPVERANRVHVDYVPTQVVCEYLMRKFKDRDVKGIKFPSTKGSGDNVALFVRPDCIEEEPPRSAYGLKRSLFRLSHKEEV
jgi:hypothetical protein